MVWFYVDDVLPFHERVLRAGNAAMGLWVRAGAYCSGQLTDGFISTEAARSMGSPAEIKRLVAAGLWRPETKDDQAGYLFHAWGEDGTGQKRQPTKAEVEEKRRKERERKANYRQSQKDTPGDSGTASTSVPPAVPDGVPAGQPEGQPAGPPPDVREESRQASDHPYQSSPFPTPDSYVSQSSHVPDREAPTDDDADRSRRAGYWSGWRIANPTRLVALIAQHVDRPVTEDQAIVIIAGLLAKANPKNPVRSVQAYVEGSLDQSWAEIQRDLDAAAVAA